VINQGATALRAENNAMSIITCNRCGRYVDTDFHDAEYVDSESIWLCEGCLERADEPAAIQKAHGGKAND